MVTKEQAVVIYINCNDAYSGKISQKDAVANMSEQLGGNPTSYGMCCQTFNDMMNGKRYSRTISIAITEVFLNNILRDYGYQQFERVLEATRDHIKYYYQITGSLQGGLRDLCQEIANRNGVKIDFSKKIFEGIDYKEPTKKWIFQANPRYYNIISAVNSLDTIEWTVKQSKKLIKSGDKIYIWMSGPEGGIIATGTALTDPIMLKGRGDNFNITDDISYDEYLGIKIKINQSFSDQIITREMLKADNRTKTLEILKFPNATNYRVKDSEARVIDSIIFGEYVPVPVEADEPQETIKYWTYAPGHGASKWEEFYNNGFMAINWNVVGDLTQYTDKAAIIEELRSSSEKDTSPTNDALCLWQFVNEIKIGDVIYAKKGKRVIVGRGIVTSDYIYDINRKEYSHTRQVKWTHYGNWELQGTDEIALKTLTNITEYTYFWKEIENLVLVDEIIIPEVKTAYPPYSKEDFLKQVYMSEESYEELTDLLKYKKNIILQGAPGVGKTYAAKRLAYSIIGNMDQDKVTMIQFHQSYSYEDFIMGYRSTASGGFEKKKGPFYEFCKKAADDQDNDYFFIIDEINRGNLSKIFGELLMLIESDKRGQKLRLIYEDELFSVPANVKIIGMMNTADRSLAMIDYALRRRFTFYDMIPAFDSDGFKEYQLTVGSKKFDRLISEIKLLNDDISSDSSLGEGFRIGHSYFCEQIEANDKRINEIIKYEIIPLVKEYWFDNETMCRKWVTKLNELVGMISD